MMIYQSVWSLQTSATASTVYPIIESTCQGSTADLVPGLSFKFVLFGAVSAGYSDLSKDYFPVKSYRGHSNMTDSARDCKNTS